MMTSRCLNNPETQEVIEQLATRIAANITTIIVNEIKSVVTAVTEDICKLIKTSTVIIVPVAAGVFFWHFRSTFSSWLDHYCDHAVHNIPMSHLCRKKVDKTCVHASQQRVNQWNLCTIMGILKLLIFFLSKTKFPR